MPFLQGPRLNGNNKMYIVMSIVICIATKCFMYIIDKFINLNIQNIDIFLPLFHLTRTELQGHKHN